MSEFLEIKRFYVYRLFSKRRGDTLYIGKGSGKRLQSQCRVHKAKGEILAYFDDEMAAYQHERAVIAELKPPRNRSPGGNGSRVKEAAASLAAAREAKVAESKRQLRIYVAKRLLSFDLRCLLEPLDRSTIDKIRLVANGYRLQDWRQAEGHQEQAHGGC